MSQFNPPTPPAGSPVAPKVKKPIYKRKWVIALAALILFYWVAPKEDSSKSSSKSKSSTSSTSSSSTIPEVPWSQNLKPDAVSSELTTASCKELGKVIKSQSNLVAARIAATEKPSSDPYDSSAYLQTINWEDTRHANSIFQLEKELVGSLLATASVSTPTDSQYKGFVADSVNACELTSIATDLDNAAYKLDSRLTSMKSSANNLPWYPKGFSEYSNSGVAFKHSTKKGLGCYSCYGIVYEVISKTSCPNQLYVEANFMDSSGAVEAWTNDTVHALQSGKIAYITLISYSVSGGGGTVEITKVDCY
jgi:hypothetical protein